MDRNDQGIMRSVVLLIAKHFKKHPDADMDEALPDNVKDDITNVISRLHDVECFAHIEMAMERPARQLKKAALNLILGKPPFE